MRQWHAAEHAAVVQAVGAGKLTPSLRAEEIGRSENCAISDHEAVAGCERRQSGRGHWRRR
eukprot:scaffold29973_cov61-Phaeocystis_antarctica.AAC.3